MRIPVFARRSNPSIDPPILRKSLQYGCDQVAAGLADWIDPEDPSKGIIAREYLPSGKALAPEPEALKSLSGMPYLKFIPPQTETWRRIQAESKVINVRRLSVPA